MAQNFDPAAWEALRELVRSSAVPDHIKTLLVQVDEHLGAQPTGGARLGDLQELTADVINMREATLAWSEVLSEMLDNLSRLQDAEQHPAGHNERQQAPAGPHWQRTLMDALETLVWDLLADGLNQDGPDVAPRAAQPPAARAPSRAGRQDGRAPAARRDAPLPRRHGRWAGAQQDRVAGAQGPHDDFNVQARLARLAAAGPPMQPGLRDVQQGNEELFFADQDGAAALDWVDWFNAPPAATDTGHVAAGGLQPSRAGMGEADDGDVIWFDGADATIAQGEVRGVDAHRYANAMPEGNMREVPRARTPPRRRNRHAVPGQRAPHADRPAGAHPACRRSKRGGRCRGRGGGGREQQDIVAPRTVVVVPHEADVPWPTEAIAPPPLTPQERWAAHLAQMVTTLPTAALAA